eukprot:TRINITY_DN13185_c0_g1_i1.p1 TRINITY_DN13185_c0_g1~~TRINITY_DN13185_c0_g1_i1.p1  ORF type:complete len:209 (-),score=17.37 TRINITY_DN13185_c0_g1_i1:451-1077(-)
MASAVPWLLSLCLVILTWCDFAECGVSFKTLQRTLIVSSAIQGPDSAENVIKAGLDTLHVSWALNASFAGADAGYHSVDVKLCFAPPSQPNRKWRKTNDDLEKDKTCGFDIVKRPYTAGSNTEDWLVAKKVPFAFYFVRVYAHNANGTIVAFGQTTDPKKTANLFQVRPISGRTVSIDVAAACFSVLSLVALISFYVFERRAFKKGQQ